VGVPPEIPSVGDYNLNPFDSNIARWRERLYAWLIDFIIITIIFQIVSFTITLSFLTDSRPDKSFGSLAPVSFSVRSLVFFVYWTYFEYTRGQSVGKMLLRLKTIRVNGGHLSLKDAAIESFGKSFLLPIDLILGWIFTNKKRQRIFNRISNTVVVKMRRSSGSWEYKT
jgi:uncharacterized RDD family membrane protein YckC